MDGRDRGRVKVDDGTLQPIETFGAIARSNMGKEIVVLFDDADGSRKARTACVRRVRTRSRSSAAAARVKVTMRSSSTGMAASAT